jgi:hypothetical protein
LWSEREDIISLQFNDSSTNISDFYPDKLTNQSNQKNEFLSGKFIKCYQIAWRISTNEVLHYKFAKVDGFFQLLNKLQPKQNE